MTPLDFALSLDIIDRERIEGCTVSRLFGESLGNCVATDLKLWTWKQ